MKPSSTSMFLQAFIARLQIVLTMLFLTMFFSLESYTSGHFIGIGQLKTKEANEFHVDYIGPFGSALGAQGLLIRMSTRENKVEPAVGLGLAAFYWLNMNAAAGVTFAENKRVTFVDFGFGMLFISLWGRLVNESERNGFGVKLNVSTDFLNR